MQHQLTPNIQLQNILLLLILFASGIFCFVPGLFGPFLLDDLQSIEPTRLTSFNWSLFWHVVFDNDTGPIGRPLTIATFVLNHLWFGHTPFAFKVVNLAFHTLNAVLVLIATEKMLSLTKYSAYKSIVAFIVTLIWYAHPLQISTVLYPVQRMVILNTFFTLLALISYIYAKQLQDHFPKRAIRQHIITYCCLIPLACLSKETGVLIPLYLAALEYTLYQKPGVNSTFQAHLNKFHKLMILGFVLGALTYFYFKLDYFLAVYQEKNYSLFSRLLTEVHALIFYLKQSVLPRLAAMGLYHDDYKLITTPTIDTFFYSSLLASLIAVASIWRKKHALISFGIALFFISHLIESTIIPLELVFEHRQYFALLGVLLALAGLSLFMMESIRSPLISKLLRTLLICYIALIYSLCLARSITWSSTENFLNNAYLRHPNSPRVHIEMANWLLTQQSYFFALMELQRAYQLQPYNAGIPLHVLLIHCHATEVPDVLYDNVDAVLTKTELNPYTMIVLDTIINNMLKQQCSSMNVDRIEQFITKLYQHPFLKYKPKYLAMLLHFEAGIKLIRGDTTGTRMLLLKSFQTYPKRAQPLLEKATIETNLNLLPQRSKTIELIHQYHPQIEIE